MFIILFPDRKRKCGHPAVPVNAQVTVSSDDFGPGSKATYKCDDGYELFGYGTYYNTEDLIHSYLPSCCTVRLSTRRLIFFDVTSTMDCLRVEIIHNLRDRHLN